MTRSERPPWLHTLVDAIDSAEPTQLARFQPPADGSGRQSAVLVLLSQAPDPQVLLILRASTMRSHAGQVAFPGGAADAGDDGPVGTALREAEEEVALDPASVDVLGALPALFLPPSSFVVTPVLGYWRSPHPVRAVDAGEVEQVAGVPDRRAGRPREPVHGQAPVRVLRARLPRRGAVHLGVHGGRPVRRPGPGWVEPAVGRGQDARSAGFDAADRTVGRRRYRRHVTTARLVPTRALAASLVLVAAVTAGCSNNKSAANREPYSGSATASVVNGVQQVLITVDGTFRFSPSTITVHPGKVHIVLQHTGGGAPHNFQLVGFPGDFVPDTDPGETKSVTFTAPAPGTYQFECTIHVRQGQTGSLIVLPQ